MGLSSALDWWDEWKLRILVLCSFSIHFFLFFARYVRLFYALRRLRVIVWLAYIGSDAVAIYALAALFNRQKTLADDGGSGNNNALEVVWVPVLLLHLGGHESISAYSMEDNELWKRHVITLVSQVTVALYVLCKWWSSERRLQAASIMLLIVGILKFGQKPWALRRSSYGSSITSTYYLSSQPRRTEEESRSQRSRRRLGIYCTAFLTCIDAYDVQAILEGQPVERVWEEGISCSLEEYVTKAQEQVKQGQQITAQAQLNKFEKDRYLVRNDIYNMFLDLAAPYSVRLHYLQSFLNLDLSNQHFVLKKWILLQYVTIYTRLRSVATCLGACSLLVLPFLSYASVFLFANSAKDGYNKNDIEVTYILFVGTTVVEFGPLLEAIFVSLFGICNPRFYTLFWTDMVSQHNIMSFCVRKKKPPALMKLATFSYFRDYINKHWYIWHECEAERISVLVRHHAEDGWKVYIPDAPTYRRFNNRRGEHTLMKLSPDLLERDKLGWTFNQPFDEYVLVWHLATDLCLHQTTDDASTSTSQACISTHRRRNSEIISNYMIYLLFICPEMLIPGARQDMFILACNDIERMIKDQPLPSSLAERSIAQRILRMGQDGDERMRESGVISNAYKLAKVLIDLNNHEMMWELIQGVWVEMLCYSASRCRGYLHAKSIGNHCEFLTYVWLLWRCMGMQTLPDMLNNLGPPEELPAATSMGGPSAWRAQRSDSNISLGPPRAMSV